MASGSGNQKDNPESGNKKPLFRRQQPTNIDSGIQFLNLSTASAPKLDSTDSNLGAQSGSKLRSSSCTAPPVSTRINTRIQRGNSESGIKLPKILFAVPRKKTSSYQPNDSTGSSQSSGGVDTKSRRSSYHSHSSSFGSVDNVFSDVETLMEAGDQSKSPARKVPPLPEEFHLAGILPPIQTNPPAARPVSEDLDTLNTLVSDTSNILNPLGFEDHDNTPDPPVLVHHFQQDEGSGATLLPQEVTQEVGGPVCIHQPPPSVDEGHLFDSLMFAPTEGDSVPLEYQNPEQESIEGSGLYDPRYNRLPPESNSSDATAQREEAEDRELKNYSNIVAENIKKMAIENFERVKAQYDKSIIWYREKCKTLQREHEELKMQIEQGNREGAAFRRERETLKGEIENLTSLRTEYDAKMREVASLREQLEQQEEQLQSLRSNLSEQNKKLSELVPLANHDWQEAQLGETFGDTQAYINSIIKFMPDEKTMKDELNRQMRKTKRRPQTTGMLQKEPTQKPENKQTLPNLPE